jgi:phage-related minor tail protein
MNCRLFSPFMITLAEVYSEMGAILNNVQDQSAKLWQAFLTNCVRIEAGGEWT